MSGAKRARGGERGGGDSPAVEMVAVSACEVCKSQPPKYKCPKCEIRYCSVPCFRKHKETPCQEHDKPKKQPKVEAAPAKTREEEEMDESDILPAAKLRQLRANKEILACLSNRHLRPLLQDIDGSPNPAEALKRAMSIPIFVEFADACLAACGVDILEKHADG